MKKEDQLALRAFYQTLGQGSFTQEQLDFYWALQKSKEARIAWIAANGAKLKIPPAILSMLTNMDNCSKADIAVIAAATIAPMVAPKVQKAIGSFMTWKIWPWNW